MDEENEEVVLSDEETLKLNMIANKLTGQYHTLTGVVEQGLFDVTQLPYDEFIPFLCAVLRTTVENAHSIQTRLYYYHIAMERAKANPQTTKNAFSKRYPFIGEIDVGVGNALALAADVLLETSNFKERLIFALIDFLKKYNDMSVRQVAKIVFKQAFGEERFLEPLDDQTIEEYLKCAMPTFALLYIIKKNPFQQQMHPESFFTKENIYQTVNNRVNESISFWWMMDPSTYYTQFSDRMVGVLPFSGITKSEEERDWQNHFYPSDRLVRDVIQKFRPCVYPGSVEHDSGLSATQRGGPPEYGTRHQQSSTTAPTAFPQGRTFEKRKRTEYSSKREEEEEEDEEEDDDEEGVVQQVKRSRYHRVSESRTPQSRCGVCLIEALPPQLVNAIVDELKDRFPIDKNVFEGVGQLSPSERDRMLSDLKNDQNNPSLFTRVKERLPWMTREQFAKYVESFLNQPRTGAYRYTVHPREPSLAELQKLEQITCEGCAHTAFNTNRNNGTADQSRAGRMVPLKIDQESDIRGWLPSAKLMGAPITFYMEYEPVLAPGRTQSSVRPANSSIYNFQLTWFDYYLGPYSILRGAPVFYRNEVYLAAEQLIQSMAHTLEIEWRPVFNRFVSVGVAIEYDTDNIDTIYYEKPLVNFPSRMVVKPLATTIDDRFYESVEIDSVYPLGTGIQAIPDTSTVLKERNAFDGARQSFEASVLSVLTMGLGMNAWMNGTRAHTNPDNSNDLKSVVHGLIESGSDAQTDAAILKAINQANKWVKKTLGDINRNSRRRNRGGDNAVDVINSLQVIQNLLKTVRVLISERIDFFNQPGHRFPIEKKATLFTGDELGNLSGTIGNKNSSFRRNIDLRTERQHRMFRFIDRQSQIGSQGSLIERSLAGSTPRMERNLVQQSLAILSPTAPSQNEGSSGKGIPDVIQRLLRDAIPADECLFRALTEPSQVQKGVQNVNGVWQVDTETAKRIQFSVVISRMKVKYPGLFYRPLYPGRFINSNDDNFNRLLTNKQIALMLALVLARCKVEIPDNQTKYLSVPGQPSGSAPLYNTYVTQVWNEIFNTSDYMQKTPDGVVNPWFVSYLPVYPAHLLEVYTAAIETNQGGNTQKWQIIDEQKRQIIKEQKQLIQQRLDRYKWFSTSAVGAHTHNDTAGRFIKLQLDNGHEVTFFVPIFQTENLVVRGLFNPAAAQQNSADDQQDVFDVYYHSPIENLQSQHRLHRP